MHPHSKKRAVFAFVLTVMVVAVVVGYLNWGKSDIEYHKRALATEEIAVVKPGKGWFRIVDRVRGWLGRPPTDHVAAVAHHQQALIDAGFLARRDLTLTNDYDLRLISPSDMLSVGGEFSYVWLSGSRQLTVIAQSNRIEQLTRWIHDRNTGNR